MLICLLGRVLHEFILGSPEGVKWDVVALRKWDLSHWQGYSIIENRKNVKKKGIEG